MKSYIKLVVLICFYTVSTLLLAQQPMHNVKLRKPTKVNFENRYYTPKLTNGREYNVVTIETASPKTHYSTLSNNGGANYYRSYGVRTETQHGVTYNAPSQLQISHASKISDRTPFEDVVSTSNQMRVKREDLPDDPSVPLGDGFLPILLLSMLWVIIKKVRNII